MGKAAGILQSVQGGPLDAMPGALLLGLFEEAEKLVGRIAGYVPDEATLSLVGDLIADSTGGLTESERQYLVELERRSSPRKAEEARRRFLERAKPDSDVADWARRLAFPLLSSSELRLVDRRERRAKTKRSATASHLLAERLRMTQETLRRHLRSARADR